MKWYEKTVLALCARSVLACLLAVLCLLSCKDNATDTKPVCPVCDAPAWWKLLGLAGETVTAITVDYDDPRTIYVGTGMSFSEGRAGKLFKSTNCGETWDTLLAGGGGFREIVIHPVDRQTIYAAWELLLKSTDGGRTWWSRSKGMRLDWETNVASIAIDPRNPDVLYAGTGEFYGGTLYKSTDAGMNWRNMWNRDSLSDGAICIAIDPRNSSIIYVGTAWRCLLVKSTDAGETWKRTGLGENPGVIDCVAIDPLQSGRLCAGVRFRGLCTSTDAGMTWVLEDVPASSIVVNGPRREMYVASGYGCYRKDAESNTWQDMNEGLFTNRLRRLTLSPDRMILYTGAHAGDSIPGGIYARRIF